MINSSPDRFTFQANKYKEQLAEEPDNKVAADWIDFYNKVKEEATMKIQCEEWQKENLEYDLRTTAWILEKVRNSEDYSKSLYAALCNNDFTKNDVWPILLDKMWHCSWRYAGGVLAHMHETGDYMDWYCSGNEGDVTAEIQEDLLKLGWCVRQQ